MGQTTANNCKTAFSLHVVESASDEYNFRFTRIKLVTVRHHLKQHPMFRVKQQHK